MLDGDALIISPVAMNYPAVANYQADGHYHARLLRNVGTYTVYVVNQGPGSVSNGVYFLVNFDD